MTRSRAELAAALGAALVLSLSAGAVRAEAEAWALDVGAGYRAVAGRAGETQHVATVVADLHRWLDDAWQVGLGLEVGRVLGSSGGDALAAGGGGPWGAGELTLRWALDAFTWVPFAQLGLGAVVREVTEIDDDLVMTSARLDPAVTGVLGADWRPARAWSLGVRLGGGLMPLAPVDARWLGRADLSATFHFE
jgi:hypothetical protein